MRRILAGIVGGAGAVVVIVVQLAVGLLALAGCVYVALRWLGFDVHTSNQGTSQWDLTSSDLQDEIRKGVQQQGGQLLGISCPPMNNIHAGDSVTCDTTISDGTHVTIRVTWNGKQLVIRKEGA